MPDNQRSMLSKVTRQCHSRKTVLTKRTHLPAVIDICQHGFTATRPPPGPATTAPAARRRLRCDRPGGNRTPDQATMSARLALVAPRRPEYGTSGNVRSAAPLPSLVSKYGACVQQNVNVRRKRHAIMGNRDLSPFREPRPRIWASPLCSTTCRQDRAR